MVIKQMQGCMGVSKGIYAPLALQARELLLPGVEIYYRWIPREKNTECDALCEVALAHQRHPKQSLATSADAPMLEGSEFVRTPLRGEQEAIFKREIMDTANRDSACGRRAFALE